MLVVCSTDGYVTFVRFPAGCLGVPLEESDVPLIVKQTFPAVYNYIAPEQPQAEADGAAEDEEEQTEALGEQVNGQPEAEGGSEMDMTAISEGDLQHVELERNESGKPEEGSVHKKKRITPIVEPLSGGSSEIVTPLQTGAAPAERNAEVSIGAHDPAAGDIQKVKKRITPSYCP